MESIFELGRVLITPGAEDLLPPDQIDRALARHAVGDWGELCGEDVQLNNKALQTGDRLLSAYRTSDGDKFWIITEAEREYTTILLPSEY